jgi:hypothetical protein
MSTELDLPAESLGSRLLDYIIEWLEYLEMKIIGDGENAVIEVFKGSEIELVEIKIVDK